MPNFVELEVVVEDQQTVSSTALALEDFADITAAQVSDSIRLWLVVNTNAVRIYLGGKVPTVSDGIKLSAGNDILISGANMLANFQIIRDGSSDSEVAYVLEGSSI